MIANLKQKSYNQIIKLLGQLKKSSPDKNKCGYLHLRKNLALLKEEKIKSSVNPGSAC